MTVVEESAVTASLEVKEVYRQLERCPFESQTVLRNPATECKLKMVYCQLSLKSHTSIEIFRLSDKGTTHIWHHVGAPLKANSSTYI